jgi:N6-adenosine-specific RNA methylase IME4
MELNRDILRKLPLALRIEIEENARRKALTQTEIATEQRRILKELRKHKTPGARNDLLKSAKATSEKGFSEVRATALVGKLFNESHKQVEKRFAVMDAAKADPETFGHLIAEMDRTGKVNAAHRAVRKVQDEKRILGLAPIAAKFKTLVVDPAWQYDGLFLGRGGPDYATMPQSELLKLPVADWAEDNCHLYLWTTNAMFPDAFELMARWGFRFNTVLSWCKPHYGMGTHFRGQTEHVLFGVRGTLRTRVSNIGTWFAAPLGEHSEKPERFYEIVRAASYPPYGEAFQRKARPDFANLFERIA